MNMKCPVCGGEAYTIDLQENRITCADCGFYCDFMALVGGRRQEERRPIDERLDFEIVAGVLKKYNGSATDVVVPEGVVEIRPNVFAGMEYIRRVTLPDSVQVIGRHVFSRCISLASIRLSDGLKEIGEGAFSGCASLIQIRIPDSVEVIHKHKPEGSVEYYTIFSNCRKLEHVEYPREKFRPEVLKGSLLWDNLKKQGKATKRCPVCGGKWGLLGCMKCGI